MPAMVDELLALTRALAPHAAARVLPADADVWQRLTETTAPPADGVLLRIGCPPPALEAVVTAAHDRLPAATRLASLDGGLLWLRVPEASGPTP